MTKEERNYFTPMAKQQLALELLKGETLPKAYGNVTRLLFTMKGNGPSLSKFSPVAVIDGLKGKDLITVTAQRADYNGRLETYVVGVVEIDFNNDNFNILLNNW
jgi:hypothetical protein